MADDPWATVPEQDDHGVLDFLKFIDFSDHEECPFDVSMREFDSNAKMSNNGGVKGSQTISILDSTDPPSQIFEARENTMSSELPSQISESGHNRISLPDIQSQIFESGGSLSEVPSQFSKSRDNSVSLPDLRPQVFQSRDSIASLPGFTSHFSKSRACTNSFGAHASHLYGAGGSSSSSLSDHPSHILRGVGESSYNPRADNFGKRSIVEDQASHIFLDANESSQYFGSRGSYISLADIPSQLYGAGGNALHSVDDHRSHNLMADAESSFNPLAEIFGERKSAILGHHPSQILRQPNHSSQFLEPPGLGISLADHPLKLHGAGGKIPNSLNHHPLPIFRDGGESSPNPLAEIFGERKSAIFGDHSSQIWRQPKHSSHFSGSQGPYISVANHPSKLHKAGGSFSTSLNDHPLPIFRAGGGSSSNPLTEALRQRMSTFLLEDHPSLDDHHPHTFKARGELGLCGNLLLHNAEGFRNNNTLQPLPMTRLQRRSIPFICNGCKVLKKFVLCNYKNFIALDIHGNKLGVVSHAIEERRTNIYHMYGEYKDPMYARIDFHSKSLDDVKHFLTQYCEELKADGYVRYPVRVQSSYQGSGDAMEEDDWEDVLSYHEEFIPEEDFDSEDYAPSNSDDMEHQHADNATWKLKGKGKCRLPKRRVTLEQRNIAARIKLEDLRVYFHLTAEEACEQLGLPLPYFKRLCRKFGVGRWPYKKIRAILKEIRNIRPMLFSNNRRTRDYTAARIESMKKELAKLLHYGS